MSTPFLRHWYVNGAVPVATTEKFAPRVWQTVTLAGCVVIAGAALRVSAAFALVTDPHAFETTTE